MRLRELFEDGRIVKGVNTTVDVGPDEIKIQAAKFGNTVDRDGRPPTLSKQVKGKSTNVLYNLGLAESEEFDDLEEGWKDWVGGAALGAAVASGGPAAYNAYKDKPVDEPKTIQIQKKEKEPDIKPNAVPKKSVTGSPHEKFLTKAAVEAGIKGEELAQFLAQTAHESHNFKSMVEYGGSLDFKKYEPKFVKDKKTKKVTQVNPKAKTLGNTKVGDGARYKGRGYIQLTGRYNYKKAGAALGLPLEDNPELVEKPEVAAQVAIWFWQNRVQPRVTDFGNTPSATKPINAGLKGLEDRKEKFQDFKVAMR